MASRINYCAEFYIQSCLQKAGKGVQEAEAAVTFLAW